MKSMPNLISAARPLFRLLPSVLVAGGILATSSAVASAQEGIASYTEEQYDRGEDAYREYCAGCHGRTLGGEGEAPGVIGTSFSNRWFGENPASMFYTYISNAMPQQAPASLTAQEYADIMAYIVSRNHYPGGETELPADLDALAGLTFPPREE